MSKTMLSNAIDTSSEHVNNALDGLASACSDAKPFLARVTRRARDAASDGYDTAREHAAALKERGQQAVDSTRGYVQDEPIKSMLIAAAVGAAVVALAGGLRRRRSR